AEIKVYALRVSALFGHNTPAQPVFSNGNVTRFDQPTIENTWDGFALPKANFPVIALDAEYEQIRPESLLVIERPPFEQTSHATTGLATVTQFDGKTTVHTMQSTAASTLAALGVSAKVTLPTISPAWFAKSPS